MVVLKRVMSYELGVLVGCVAGVSGFFAVSSSAGYWVLVGDADRFQSSSQYPCVYEGCEWAG